MSASLGQPEGGQDFDLNLAPIIDCFTVLITFMLASASFLAIGVFDAATAANTNVPSANQTPPAIRVDVELTGKKELKLRVEGKAKFQKVFPPKEGTYDGTTLVGELKSLKSKFPDTTGFVLTAEDEIEYSQLIGLMEVFRKQVPALSILLGGL